MIIVYLFIVFIYFVLDLFFILFVFGIEFYLECLVVFLGVFMSFGWLNYFGDLCCEIWGCIEGSYVSVSVGSGIWDVVGLFFLWGEGFFFYKNNIWLWDWFC